MSPKRLKPKVARRKAAVKPADTREIRFLSRSAVEALHRESLCEHGGLDGLRDAGLLQSAIARCLNKAMYEPESSIPQLAATLAFGLARNHPFNDGNKRIALIASCTFAQLNKVHIRASEADAYRTFMALAAGQLSERDLAAWFEEHARSR